MALMCFRSEMEQGRYADVIFNLILVACIPFIAPDRFSESPGMSQNGEALKPHPQSGEPGVPLDI